MSTTKTAQDLRGSTTPEQHTKAENTGKRIPLYKGVSCVTYVKVPGVHGLRRTNWFDVPDEDYMAGSRTGVKAAYEVMVAARDQDFDSFQSVFEAAINVLNESKKHPNKNTDGAGAAVSFLWTMTEILELAAKKLDLSELMAKSLGWHEEFLQGSLSDMKADNAAFVARMTADKAQKKRGSATPQRGSA